MSKHPNVVSGDDLPWNELGHGDKFAARSKRLGSAAGGKKLGCSLYEVPPGKRPFPYHAHFGNEEAIYVLAGEGTLRLGGVEVPLKAGDYAAMPVGEVHAHQVINTSSETLRLLCFSTMLEPEIVKYPDSNKLGAMAGYPPTPALRAIVKLDSTVDYWLGED
jgi:uncharacterized cupin superfamily protein